MLLAAIVLVVGLAGFWAGRVTLQEPPGQTQAPDASVTVEVTAQSVGKVLTYNVTAAQTRASLASNTVTGVVTSAATSGEFKVGQVAYVVGATPVRLVQGTTPFWRALSEDDSGADVAQLKRALKSLGYLSDAAGVRFDRATTAAVIRWQRATGAERTGEIPLGQLVAVPRLPGKVFVDKKVARPGAVLAGGEQIISAATGDPVFTLPLQQEQARLVPASATLKVHSGSLTWPAVITSSTNDANGGVTFALSAPGGGSVCGQHCGQLPAADTTYLFSDVEVVAPATGPAVPVAAIITQADGTTTVTVVAGTGARSQRTVQVRASQDGVAIVGGVEVGEHVQVLSASPSPVATPS